MPMIVNWIDAQAVDAKPSLLKFNRRLAPAGSSPNFPDMAFVQREDILDLQKVESSKSQAIITDYRRQIGRRERRELLRETARFDTKVAYPSEHRNNWFASCTSYASRVYLGMKDGYILVYGQSDWTPEMKLDTEERAFVMNLCIDTSRQLLISGSFDHSISFWNVRTGERILKFSEEIGRIRRNVYFRLQVAMGWLIALSSHRVGEWQSTPSMLTFRQLSKPLDQMHKADRKICAPYGLQFTDFEVDSTNIAVLWQSALGPNGGHHQIIIICGKSLDILREVVSESCGYAQFAFSRGFVYLGLFTTDFRAVKASDGTSSVVIPKERRPNRQHRLAILMGSNSKYVVFVELTGNSHFKMNVCSLASRSTPSQLVLSVEETMDGEVYIDILLTVDDLQIILFLRLESGISKIIVWDFV